MPAYLKCYCLIRAWLEFDRRRLSYDAHFGGRVSFLTVFVQVSETCTNDSLMRSCYFAPVTVLADIDRMLCKAETLCDDVAASIAVGALTPVISFYFAWSVSHIRMVGLVLAVARHRPKRYPVTQQATPMRHQKQPVAVVGSGLV